MTAFTIQERFFYPTLSAFIRFFCVPNAFFRIIGYALIMKAGNFSDLVSTTRADVAGTHAELGTAGIILKTAFEHG